MLSNVVDWNIGELWGDRNDGITVDLPERGTREGARHVDRGRRGGVGDAFHWQREVGGGLGLDLEHVYKASRKRLDERRDESEGLEVSQRRV